MKKLIYVFSASFLALTTLNSCNKKLKDRLNELDSQVGALENKNASLESSIDDTQSELDAKNVLLKNLESQGISSTPLKAVTNFKDDNNADHTVTSEYYYLDEGYYDNLFTKNLDGSYDVWVGRTNVVGGGDDVEVYFTIAPDGKSIVTFDDNDYFRHEWYDSEWSNDTRHPYNNKRVWFDDYEYLDVKYTPTYEATLNSFDPATGMIDFSIKLSYSDAQVTELTTAGQTNRLPNTDKAVSTTFSFNGSLDFVNVKYVY